MVASLPDIGKTPAGVATPAAPFSTLSGLYNTTLSLGLDQIGFDVIPVDVYTLLNEVLANPAAFGFTNTTTPACTTSSSLLCTPATLRDPNAPNTWVFADGVHPTNGAAAVVAQYAESIVEAPEKIAMLAEVPLQLAGTQRRAIENRYISQPGPRPIGKFDVYAAYDYNPSKLDRTAVGPGNDNTGHTLTVGGDTQFTDMLSAGMALGYSWNDSDFDNNAGNFKMNAGMLTLYASAGSANGYVAAAATFGDLDYTDVRRNIALGSLTRTESGKTRGSLQSYLLTGGYTFNVGNLAHGPVGSVTWQKVNVDDYTESGADSTTMRFSAQERESLITSIGWQATTVASLGGTSVVPFGRLSWEHEAKDDQRFVRAGLVTMGGTFAMPVFRPGDNWARLDLAISTKLGPSAVGYVAYSGVLGQSDAKSNALTFGIRMPL
jgi:outer membrane lipase/esterase